MQNQCAEIKLRAERKAGEMLAEMPKHNGDPRLHDATRLDDLGVTKTQSSRWQSIASLPEDELPMGNFCSASDPSPDRRTFRRA